MLALQFDIRSSARYPQTPALCLAAGRRGSQAQERSGPLLYIRSHSTSSTSRRTHLRNRGVIPPFKYLALLRFMHGRSPLLLRSALKKYFETGVSRRSPSCTPTSIMDKLECLGAKLQLCALRLSDHGGACQGCREPGHGRSLTRAPVTPGSVAVVGLRSGPALNLTS